jgi:hypothetical protein
MNSAWEGCACGGELQDKANELGLIQKTPGGYDPEKHGEYSLLYAEPGDDWFEFAPWVRKP